jgi:hypothetical protein
MLKNKQLVAIVSLGLVLLGIPTLLYFSQQKQETRSRATSSTTLYYSPTSSVTAPLSMQEGDQITMDIFVDPGTNLPSLIKLHLQYDPMTFQVTKNSFVSNTTAFPSTIEGPLVSDGNLYVSLSIGSDGTKVIQEVTKVGSLTLTAIAPTATSPALLSFGDKSQVFSLAGSDQANENVLSTTNGAYINVFAKPTPSILPTSIPTEILSPTPLPTATPLPTMPTITTLPSATTIPTATPTIPPLATRLTFPLFMHGIGNSGDNANPSSELSNKDPLHPQRPLTVEIYDVNNQLAASTSGTVTYDTQNGNFVGTITLNDIPQGSYIVKVKSSGHLRKIVPGIQTIIPEQENVMPETTLVAGDVNGDNLINILDYNLLTGCYSDFLPAVSCTDTMKELTDLNDDGEVNQIDYNFFLREITVQAGS